MFRIGCSSFLASFLGSLTENASSFAVKSSVESSFIEENDALSTFTVKFCKIRKVNIYIHVRIKFAI